MIPILLKLGSFIRSPIGKYLLIGLACIALIWGFAAWNRADQHAKDQIHERKAVAAVQADLNTCHLNTATLEASLSRQSAAVDALKAESDARVAQSQKAASSARAVAESFRQTAGDILGRKAGVDKCAAAAELIGEVR